MRKKNSPATNGGVDQGTTTTANKEKPANRGKGGDPLALFRLLVKQPPADHDFHTCPICAHYGITEI